MTASKDQWVFFSRERGLFDPVDLCRKGTWVFLFQKTPSYFCGSLLLIFRDFKPSKNLSDLSSMFDQKKHVVSGFQASKIGPKPYSFKWWVYFPWWLTNGRIRIKEKSQLPSLSLSKALISWGTLGFSWTTHSKQLCGIRAKSQDGSFYFTHICKNYRFTSGHIYDSSGVFGQQTLFKQRENRRLEIYVSFFGCCGSCFFGFHQGPLWPKFSWFTSRLDALMQKTRLF